MPDVMMSDLLMLEYIIKRLELRELGALRFMKMIRLG